MISIREVSLKNLYRIVMIRCTIIGLVHDLTLNYRVRLETSSADINLTIKFLKVALQNVLIFWRHRHQIIM